MLEEIKALKESIEDEQFNEVSDVLGGELYKLFLIALSSKTEDDAQSRVKSFGDALRGHPIRAFKLYGQLNEKQKTLIQDLMEE